MNWDRITNVILVLSVVAAVGFMAEQRFQKPKSPGPLASVERIGSVDTLQTVLETSRTGIEVALVTDYECPFCKTVDSVLSTLDVTKAVIHFPLQGHKQAIPAARALECAADPSKMNKALFANQDSLGLLSWASLAYRIGDDTTAFLDCLRTEEANAKWKAGQQFALKHEIAGTPAAVINGVLYRPIWPDKLIEVVDSLSRTRRK